MYGKLPAESGPIRTFLYIIQPMGKSNKTMALDPWSFCLWYCIEWATCYLLFAGINGYGSKEHVPLVIILILLFRTCQWYWILIQSQLNHMASNHYVLLSWLVE